MYFALKHERLVKHANCEQIVLPIQGSKLAPKSDHFEPRLGLFQRQGRLQHRLLLGGEHDAVRPQQVEAHG